jgi:hypothetical protein
MDNQEYDCYEVELNRFFNILSPSNLIMLAGLVSLSATGIIAYFVSDKVALRDAIFTCLGCTVIMIVKIFSSPKCLFVTPKSIKYRYRTALLTMLLHGKVRFGESNEPRYEKSHTLYNIKNIEYFQTPLEKIFSCGHICIHSDVTIGGKQESNSTFTIYGITDFDEVSVWMRSFIILPVNN